MYEYARARGRLSACLGLCERGGWGERESIILFRNNKGYVRVIGSKLPRYYLVQLDITGHRSGAAISVVYQVMYKSCVH